MRLLKRLFVSLVVLVALLLLISFLLPKTYSVARSTVINAPIETVFDQVNTVRHWESWGPWQQKDSTIQATYNAIPSGEGASYSWTSEKSGKGKLTISESVPHERIRTELDFGDHGKAAGLWEFAESDGGVKVTWGISGEANNPIMRYIGLLMDGMAGPDFEKGLANIKARVEGGS